ncbi:Protein NLRC3 [Gigaspora margarita]|uniref:Protein NLRC3 n=1 Tax=Gigaspora margarita TaxID=4874 RepID=A0A8H3X3J9_GIGMA|nr:Protein NLRC3 [Gigaspora margarita]
MLSTCSCNNNALTTINLSSNELEADFGKMLADTLHKNISLISLDLSNNGLGYSEVEPIADSLIKNNTLIYLSLLYNGIGSLKGKVLANAIYSNTMLTTLNLRDLSYNEFDYIVKELICKNSGITKSETINLSDSEDFASYGD